MKRLICAIAILALSLNMTLAQATKKAGTKSENKTTSSTIQPAATTPVTGSGTPGQLTKWMGVDGSNTFTVGDSNITEDKFGKIGVGTRMPTSLFTVRGMIETTLGGYKFPDGTVQTTAGLGTLFHDSTLTGNGTSASSLGVAVPLLLTGSVPPDLATAVIQATNTSVAGVGVSAIGGDGGQGIGGDGVQARGGAGSDSFAISAGVRAFGADKTNSHTFAGEGVRSMGGNVVGHVSGGISGGTGVRAIGGSSDAANGGFGVVALGGASNSGQDPGGTAIFAQGGNSSAGSIFLGKAGTFRGFVEIDGSLNVTGTKNFKIDHPLDPENKYLVHAAIESSEVLNFYSGNIVTDANGEAVVTLPEWFEALNRDMRYQLTVLGSFAQAIVAEKVKHNRFTIKTNAPNVEVSWQVTGVRSDPLMLGHPFQAVEDKTERERGFYLNPEGYNQPEERGIEWARHPEMMREMKEARTKQMEELKQKARGSDR